VKRAARRNLIRQASLYLNETARQAFLATIEIRVVRRLETPYPPHNHWIFETSRVQDQWADLLREGRLYDQRTQRHPEHILDTGKLVHDLSPSQSAFFVERVDGPSRSKQVPSRFPNTAKNTFEVPGFPGRYRLVLAVIRNFCGSDKVVEWAKQTAITYTKVSKGVRLDDPGQLSIAGYTAGSLTKPTFGWSQNFKNAATRSAHSDSKYEVSCMFAAYWNILMSKIHPAVMQDYEGLGWGQGVGCRMHPTLGAELGYMIKIAGDEYRFCDAPLAPPAGLVSYNYARYMHTEQNATEYVVAWNIARERRTAEFGGNFFVTSYGIRVQNATDTAFAFHHFDCHGTSLPDFISQSGTEAIPWRQIGLGFHTVTRLHTLWQR